jgi:hypothetical protein
VHLGHCLAAEARDPPEGGLLLGIVAAATVPRSRYSATVNTPSIAGKITTPAQLATSAHASTTPRTISGARWRSSSATQLTASVAHSTPLRGPAPLAWILSAAAPSSAISTTGT